MIMKLRDYWNELRDLNTLFVIVMIILVAITIISCILVYQPGDFTAWWTTSGRRRTRGWTRPCQAIFA